MFEFFRNMGQMASVLRNMPRLQEEMAQMQGRLAQVVAGSGLTWTTHRFWPRSGLSFSPSMPRTATEAMVSLDVPLRRLLRVYLANRGVWDAIIGAGPTCSVAATDEDVDAYVAAFGDLVDELGSLPNHG